LSHAAFLYALACVAFWLIVILAYDRAKRWTKVET